MAEPERTPWQIDRDNAEYRGDLPDAWGPFHRHFASDAVHRDSGPECDQPGTPQRVYVFDEYALDEHERIVARWAAAHPEQFTPEPPARKPMPVTPVRFPPELAEAARQVADLDGMTLSAWIRNVVGHEIGRREDSGPPRARMSPEDIEMQQLFEGHYTKRDPAD